MKHARAKVTMPMMRKYRKKPVVISAMQFDGSHASALDINGIWPSRVVLVTNEDGSFAGKLGIETLEGVMTASAGDFIIQGVNSEIYPCKADIFAKTYEVVE